MEIAEKLYNSLQSLRYPSSGNDTQHELDILQIFIDHGFTQQNSHPDYKTPGQKELFIADRGSESLLAESFPTGLHIIHHPFGKRRHPDFIAIINGTPIVVEAKSCGTQKVPKFMFGNHLLNPDHRSGFIIFTHKSDGTELLLPSDLITMHNYLLLQKHKIERDELQAKQDAEFNELCGGVGMQHYNRVNYLSRGGREHTDYIAKSRDLRLAKHVLFLLKSCE